MKSDPDALDWHLDPQEFAQLLAFARLLRPNFRRDLRRARNAVVRQHRVWRERSTR